MREISETEKKRILYDMLVYFADFCESLGLQYFLTYGTLIGAVRHGGFIPWDDDIDVWMPREDYDKLLFEYRNKLDSKLYELDSIELNPLFLYTFCKLSRKNTMQLPLPFLNKYVERVSIDIFALDVFPGSDNEEIAHAEYMNMYEREMQILNQYHRYRSVKDIGLRKLLKQIIFKAAVLRYGNIVERIRKWSRMLADCPHQERVQYLATSGYRYLYKREWFEKTVKLKFEVDMFCVPSGYDSILRTIYGDYMTPPPPEKRIPPHRFKSYYTDDDGNHQ